MANIKLKHKSSDLIPEHIRDNYKQFTAFLDTYHDWLEQNQIDIAKSGDIDSTDAKFIQNFKTQTNSVGMTFPNIDDRVLIRHLKNIFISKGTEESYRTLFRMMYGKDIIIKYPEQMCLKPSDGKWEQLISIFVEAESGSAFDMIDRIIKVTTQSKQVINLTINNVSLRREGGGVSTISLLSGGSGYVNPKIIFSGGGGTGATAHAVVVGGVITSILVDNPGHNYSTPPTITITDNAGTGATVNAVRMYMSPSIYECNIDKHYYGTLSAGDSVQFGTFKGKILPTINSFEIKNPGKNFRLGQLFDVDTTFGHGATIKVTKLNANKGIAELKFIKFGYGYISDFETSNIIPPNISTSTESNGFVGLNGTFSDYVISDPSGGYVLKETYTSTPGQEQYSTDYAGDVVREFYSVNKYNGDVSNAATIKFKLGAVCKYPGNYINSDGMLSDENKIQDSRLYQKYSYIIQADEKLDTYKDLVKTHLHPAGLALFGEYNLRNDFKIGLKLSSLLSVFSIKHSDAVSASESYTKYFTVEVNDARNSLLGTQLDWAIPNPVIDYIGGLPIYTKNDLLKLIDFPSIDYVAPNTVPLGQEQLIANFVWTSATSYLAGVVLQSGSNYYRVDVSGTVGTIAPTFTSGSVTDGTATITFIGTWYGTNDSDIFWLQKELSDVGLSVDNLLGLPNGRADSYNNFELLLGTMNSRNVTGVAQTSSINSVTLDANADQTPTRFNYNRLTITSGPGAGQVRTVKTSGKNKLTYSNDFINPVWNSGNLNITTGYLDPFGTNKASLLKTNILYAYPNHGTYPAANDTLTFYAKRGTTNWVHMTFKYYSVGTETAWFDLLNGVTGTTGSNLITSITPAGNGYYKCSATKKVATTSEFVIVSPCAGNSLYSNVNDSCYLYCVNLSDNQNDEPIITLGSPAVGVVVDSNWSSNLVRNSGVLNVAPWAGCSPFPNGQYLDESNQLRQLWNISKTVAIGSESLGQVVAQFAQPNESITLSCVLLAGSSTACDVGIYGSGAGWAIASDAVATVISGPGVIAPTIFGALYNVSGLSTTVPTFIKITRTFRISEMPGILFYPDTFQSAIIGRSVNVGRIQVESGNTHSVYIPTGASMEFIPGSTSTYSLDDRDMFDITNLYDSTMISMDGPGLMIGDSWDNPVIQDFDINIGIPLSKDLTTSINGGIPALDDTTLLVDGGNVILNVYVDPLNQYMTGNYVHTPPDAVF